VYFSNHHGANQCDSQVPSHKVRASVAKASAAVSPNEDEDALEHLTKHLDEQCIERGEAHALDDDGAKLEYG
jgi:hypothetical protein